jgi:uncharacterized protein YfaP (DUF2135 family)
LAEIIKAKLRYGVSLDVGDDGVYNVRVDDAIVFSSRVRAAAEIEFDGAVETRSAGTREARSREQAHFAAQSVLAEAARQKSAARQAGRLRGKGG